MTDDDDPLAGLDFEVDEPEVEDLTSLSAWTLAARHTQVRKELMDLGELWIPREGWSERGKELHSTFTALQIETNRRLEERRKG